MHLTLLAVCYFPSSYKRYFSLHLSGNVLAPYLAASNAYSHRRPCFLLLSWRTFTKTAESRSESLSKCIFCAKHWTCRAGCPADSVRCAKDALALASISMPAEDIDGGGARHPVSPEDIDGRVPQFIASACGCPWGAERLGLAMGSSERDARQSGHLEELGRPGYIRDRTFKRCMEDQTGCKVWRTTYQFLDWFLVKIAKVSSFANGNSAPKSPRNPW